jgi:hypothetical protein
MSLMGLKEASKLTGKNAATIHRAMKSGRLSYTLNANGDRVVDLSELERVFPIVKVPELRDELRGNLSQRLETVLMKLEVEQAKSTILQERLADKDGAISDLRSRLDAEAEERRKAQSQLMALLTDQRAKAEPPRRGWFAWFRR